MKHNLGTLRLTSSDERSVKSVVSSNWISPGPKVAQFQKSFAAVHQQKYGVMTNSGTDALRIALAALKERGNWKDGDIVFVPAVTFVATVNVVLQLNLTPKLVDVSMTDYNLNPWNLERLYYTPDNEKSWPKNARCVIPVHIAGVPCDMPQILKVAKRRNLAVLEDSCETLGVPGIAKGDATAFSFYVAHLLTTGVGGMATTNDPKLNQLMWSFCNHGRRDRGAFRFDRIGYSCRPTEFEAALGLNQLYRLREILNKRRRIARLLHETLMPYPELHTHFVPESANMFFPLLLKEGSPVRKEVLMEFLGKHGIETRELLPLINQPCYKGLWDTTNGFTVAKSVNERGFYIGCHQDMTLDDVRDIGETFDKFFSVKRREKTVERLSRIRASQKDQKADYGGNCQKNKSQDPGKLRQIVQGQRAA